MNISPQKTLGYFIVIVSLIFALVYLKNQESLLKSALSISFWEFFSLIGLVLLSLGLNGFKVMWIQKIFKNDLSNLEAFSLASANAMWNYLPFTGGLVVRGAYLKQKYKFPWAKFISTVLASYIISFAAFGVFGLVASLVFLEGGSKITFSLIFLGLVLGSATIANSEKIIKKLNLRLPIRLWKTIIGFQALSKAKSVFLKLVLLDILIIFLDSSRLFLVSIFSGQTISFGAALLITPLTIIASAVNITPGGLIIREGIITLAASELNYSTQTGLVVATLDRAAVIIGIFLAGILGSVYLSKKLSEK